MNQGQGTKHQHPDQPPSTPTHDAGFMSPHEDYIISSQELLELLDQYQSGTVSSLKESNQLLTHVLEMIKPQFNNHIKTLKDTTSDVNRIKTKMMTIFTSLRQMRQQLVKAGIVIEGEVDLVEEIDRKDKEELQQRRLEYLEKKRLEKEEEEEQGKEKQENGQETVTTTSGIDMLPQQSFPNDEQQLASEK